MRRGFGLRSLFLLGLVLALAGEVRAEPRPCDDDRIRVDAGDRATRERICAAVEAARPLLAACGIRQKIPLAIETTGTLIHAAGPCLAAYDCADGTIRIVAPDRLRAHLAPNDPYALLPDDAVFASLLSHELSHALLHQALGDRLVPLVDHEYVAAAMELSTMPPEHRQILLAAAGVSPPVPDGTISGFLYGIAPRRFSAAAYLHFDGRGCGPIRGILDGTFSFRVQP